MVLKNLSDAKQVQIPDERKTFNKEMAPSCVQFSNNNIYARMPYPEYLKITMTFTAAVATQ